MKIKYQLGIIFKTEKHNGYKCVTHWDEPETLYKTYIKNVENLKYLYRNGYIEVLNKDGSKKCSLYLDVYNLSYQEAFIEVVFKKFKHKELIYLW